MESHTFEYMDLGVIFWIFIIISSTRLQSYCFLALIFAICQHPSNIKNLRITTRPLGVYLLQIRACRYLPERILGIALTDPVISQVFRLIVLEAPNGSGSVSG